VYQAIFPTGVYIGSGQITLRRNQHMAGGSSIALALKEKALSFVVLAGCSKDWCLVYEKQAIQRQLSLGVELLNIYYTGVQRQ